MSSYLPKRTLAVKHALLLGTLLGSFSQGAEGQTVTDIGNAVRESERIQREQELRRQEQIERNERSAAPPTRLEAPPPPTPAGKGEGCRDIKAIALEGAEHMPKPVQDGITGPYLNRCLGVPEIQELMSAITKFYIDKGYATTRAYIPAQDLTTGNLKILVVEGKVSGIELEDGGKNSVLMETIFPETTGKVLNLREFEQGLDQINRLASNHATMDIKPGEEAGDSVVVIKNAPTKRWHGNVSADNQGTRSTGRKQAGATASFDDLLGLNEYTSITRRQSQPFNDDGGRSSSENYYASFPYGHTMFSGGVTHSRYRSVLNTAGGLKLKLNGDSTNIFGKIDHVLWRSQTDKVTVSSTLTTKETNSFLDGQKLGVSSRRITVLDVDADYNRPLLGGAFDVSGGYSRGLNAFNALDDRGGLPGGAPRAQFEKLRLNASYNRPFTVYERAFLFSTQFASQVALDTLYGSEQFSIGGIYSVRGFYDVTLVNDHGYYFRNELGMPRSLGTIDGVELTMKPYIGLDFGSVGGRSQHSPSGTLVGAAAGSAFNLGPVFLNVFAGQPIASPDRIGHDGFTLFGQLSVNF